MKAIYETKVTALGSCVDEFQDIGMFVLFGNGAPEELRDYCYSIVVKKIEGEIKPNYILEIDENRYNITAVGKEAPMTLETLGHCTINFSGQTEVDLPGTIYVENKPMPYITVGTVIKILKKQ